MMRASVTGKLAFAAQRMQWARRRSGIVMVSPIRKGASPSASPRRVAERSNSQRRLSLMAGRRISSGRTKLWRPAIQRTASNSSMMRLVKASCRARSSVPAGWVSAPWRSPR
jgi:hypothetical protein